MESEREQSLEMSVGRYLASLYSYPRVCVSLSTVTRHRRDPLEPLELNTTHRWYYLANSQCAHRGGPFEDTATIRRNLSLSLFYRYYFIPPLQVHILFTPFSVIMIFFYLYRLFYHCVDCIRRYVRHLYTTLAYRLILFYIISSSTKTTRVY